MKRLIKSLVLAISMYSIIPMPMISCDEEDTKYTMIFFPIIGFVIGALIIGWTWLCDHFQILGLSRTLIIGAIPLVVTGGFHMDGFMDTSDARSSYQPREKKLEILKDSHIGAFAVIRVIIYMLVFLAAIDMLFVVKKQSIILFSFGFMMSRILSGIAVVTFPSARKEGMLFFTAKAAQRNANLIVLCIEGILLSVVMCLVDWKRAIAVIAVALLSFLYYWLMSRRVFGGITGDLAGWFVTFTECAIAVGLAIMNGVGICV